MKLADLQRAWNEAGYADPLWAVLSHPDKRGNKWVLEEFLATGVEEINAVMDYVVSLGIVRPRRRALDFGCGPGRLTQALAAYFDAVDGVDISASMIDLANKFNRCPDRCRYYVNASDDLQRFDDASFDFIYSNITLQHIEPAHTRRYLLEFFRLLTPEGVLIFQLPSTQTGALRQAKGLIPRQVLTGYRWLRYRNHPAATMYGIGREEVVRFCQENGAQVLDITQNQDAGKGWVSFRYCCRGASSQQ